MGDFERAVDFLPDRLQERLRRVSLSDRCRVQEIRLRKDGLLSLSFPEGERTPDGWGRLFDKPDERSLFCTGEELEKTFLRLCDYSVHSHEQELSEGFVTAPGGIRAGVAGTAVRQNGRVIAVRDIRSLCIRVAGRHDGCADRLRPLFSSGTVPSLLILGEPSAGKTSLLRDIARQLSDGSFGRRFRVTVVDERGEIAGVGGLSNCDVLTGCLKPQGILQAVRTLAPDVILLDELGTLNEVEAIAENLNAGVPAIATAHARDMTECQKREAIRLALSRRVFDKLVFLSGRSAPGSIREIREGDTLEIVRGNWADRGGTADRLVDDRAASPAPESAGRFTRLAE